MLMFICRYPWVECALSSPDLTLASNPVGCYSTREKDCESSRQVLDLAWIGPRNNESFDLGSEFHKHIATFEGFIRPVASEGTDSAASQPS